MYLESIDTSKQHERVSHQLNDRRIMISRLTKAPPQPSRDTKKGYLLRLVSWPPTILGSLSVAPFRLSPSRAILVSLESLIFERKPELRLYSLGETMSIELLLRRVILVSLESLIFEWKPELRL